MIAIAEPLTSVNYSGHVSSERAARLCGGYRRLVLAICELNGIPVTLGPNGIHWVRESDLPRIGELVKRWKNRPRLSAGPFRHQAGGGKGGGAGRPPGLVSAAPFHD